MTSARMARLSSGSRVAFPQQAAKSKKKKKEKRKKRGEEVSSIFSGLYERTTPWEIAGQRASQLRLWEAYISATFVATEPARRARGTSTWELRERRAFARLALVNINYCYEYDASPRPLNIPPPPPPKENLQSLASSCRR